MLWADPRLGIARGNGTKSSILATLAYLDQTRITTETTANIQAPYTRMPALAERWQRLYNSLSACVTATCTMGYCYNNILNIIIKHWQS